MPSPVDIDLRNYEVLANALKGDGNPLGFYIVSRAIFPNPNGADTNGSIFIGQGASGKSMLLSQTVSLLKQKGNIDELRAKHLGASGLEARTSTWIIPQIYPFDLAVDYVRNETGMHQKNWQPEVWDRVSDKLFRDINPALDALKNQDKLSAKRREPIWHIFNDSVVVGDLNKGTSAIAELIKRRDVAVYGVISDPKNQDRANRLRKAAMTLSAEKMEQLFLDEGVQVDIDDFNRVPDLLKNMAPEALIEQNNQQIEALTDQVLGNGLASFDDCPLPESVQEKIRANYSSQEIDGVIRYYQRRFIHMNYLLRVKLRAPQRNAVPLFNVHLKDQRIHWYQTDLDNSTP